MIHNYTIMLSICPVRPIFDLRTNPPTLKDWFSGHSDRFSPFDYLSYIV